VYVYLYKGSLRCKELVSECKRPRPTWAGRPKASVMECGWECRAVANGGSDAEIVPRRASWGNAWGRNYLLS